MAISWLLEASLVRGDHRTLQREVPHRALPLLAFLAAVEHSKSTCSFHCFNVHLDLFNFRRNPMTISEANYLLADCYRAVGPSSNFDRFV